MAGLAARSRPASVSGRRAVTRISRREHALGVRALSLSQQRQRGERLFDRVASAPATLDDKQQPCMCGVGPDKGVDCCTGKGTGARFGRPQPFKA